MGLGLDVRAMLPPSRYSLPSSLLWSLVDMKRNNCFPMLQRLLLLLLWGFLWLPVSSPAEAADATVQPVMFSSLSGVTRIVIQTGAKVQYRASRLSNPDRIYFDIQGARYPGKQNDVIQVGDTLLKRIRIGKKDDASLRLVLDVQQAVRFITSQASNPESLAIELMPAAASPALAPPPPAASATLAATTPTRPAHSPVSFNSSGPPESASPCVEFLTPRAEPARNGQDGRRSLTRVLGLKINRVVLDAGHGGDDTGTISCTGLMEKEVVLDVTRRLGQLIAEKLNCEVIYTRTEDVSVPLRARSSLARGKDADLFVSIHANSSRAHTVAGFETYYLNFTNREQAREVAARENAVASESVHELGDLVQRITRSEKQRESAELAAMIQASLYGSLARKNPLQTNRGVKQAPFLVLVGTKVPSVLVEIGFLSNLEEEKLLHDSDHRQRIVEALYLGLARYMGSLSHVEKPKLEISESSARARGGAAGY
jgi:N-acetylmuramoyl-L-alanine amidase